MKNKLNEMIMWKAYTTPFNKVLSSGNIMLSRDKILNFLIVTFANTKEGEILYKIDKQQGPTV